MWYWWEEIKMSVTLYRSDPSAFKSNKSRPDSLHISHVTANKYFFRMLYNDLNKDTIGIYLNKKDVLSMANKILNDEANRLLRDE